MTHYSNDVIWGKGWVDITLPKFLFTRRKECIIKLAIKILCFIDLKILALLIYGQKTVLEDGKRQWVFFLFIVWLKLTIFGHCRKN